MVAVVLESQASVPVHAAQVVLIWPIWAPVSLPNRSMRYPLAFNLLKLKEKNVNQVLSPGVKGASIWSI